jgi:hypothetical protein
MEEEKSFIYRNNQFRHSEVDIPSNPIEEFNETVQNIQFPRKNHVKQKMNSFGHRRSIGNHGR